MPKNLKPNDLNTLAWYRLTGKACTILNFAYTVIRPNANP